MINSIESCCQVEEAQGWQLTIVSCMVAEVDANNDGDDDDESTVSVVDNADRLLYTFITAVSVL